MTQCNTLNTKLSNLQLNPKLCGGMVGGGGGGPHGGISDKQISGQSAIKRNCHNSRTGDDNDVKLVPVTKFNKRNKTKCKIFGDNVMLENCDAIVIFPIYSQFGAVWKPDARWIVCKTYILTNSNLLSYKNWKQN